MLMVWSEAQSNPKVKELLAGAQRGIAVIDRDRRSSMQFKLLSRVIQEPPRSGES
jgi:hypothetical protein